MSKLGKRDIIDVDHTIKQWKEDMVNTDSWKQPFKEDLESFCFSSFVQEAYDNELLYSFYNGDIPIYYSFSNDLENFMKYIFPVFVKELEKEVNSQNG